MLSFLCAGFFPDQRRDVHETWEKRGEIALMIKYHTPLRNMIKWGKLSYGHVTFI